MIPEFNKGDLVKWTPDIDPAEHGSPQQSKAGILFGLFDHETGVELQSQYDASDVVVEALVQFDGAPQYVFLHELELLSKVKK